MGKALSIFGLSLIALAASFCAKRYLDVSIDVTYDDYAVVYQPTYSHYEEFSRNHIICEEDTFKYVLTQLRLDGYDIKASKVDSNVECVASKADDEVTYSLSYDGYGNLICVSSDYEKSSMPFTYLIEGDE